MLSDNAPVQKVDAFSGYFELELNLGFTTSILQSRPCNL